MSDGAGLKHAPEGYSVVVGHVLRRTELGTTASKTVPRVR
jgi:hypothetical protein